MSKEVEQAAIELKQALDSSKIVQEYNQLAEQIASSTELNEMEAELKKLQQQLVDTLDKNLETAHAIVLKQYEELRKSYDNHPLYQNYLNYKEEINELLKEVSDIVKNPNKID